MTNATFAYAILVPLCLLICAIGVWVSKRRKRNAKPNDLLTDWKRGKVE